MKDKRNFIMYSNGYFELIDSWNLTILHMIDVGAIKFAIRMTEEPTIWLRSNEGIAKEEKIPFVSGL